VVVAVVGTVLSLLAAAWVWRGAVDGAQRRQRAELSTLADRTRTSMLATVAQLDALTSVYAELPDSAVRPGRTRYALRKLLDDPVVQGVGVAEHVLASQRPAFERRFGAPIVQMRDGTLVKSPQQASYMVLVDAVSRAGRPFAAIDLSRAPGRIAAIRNARLGVTGMTPPIRELQTGRPAIAIYAPVRGRGGRATDLVVVGAYDGERLVAKLRGYGGPALQVRDGAVPLGAATHGVLRDPRSRTIAVLGRRWTITIGRPAVAWTDALLAALVGLLLTMAAAVAAAVLIRRDARSRDEVRAAENRFRTAFDEAPLGMALLDLRGVVLQANRSLLQLTGTEWGAPIRMHLEALVHPEDLQAIREGLGDLLGRQVLSDTREARLMHTAGHELWCQLHTTLVHDGAGSPSHLLVQVLDVTEQRRQESQLRHLADHDPLTGLFNRRTFERSVTEHLERTAGHGGDGALLMIDLDNFTAVNDTLGHHVGDELLIRTAHALRSRLRDTDALARLGGDEFAVLLPRASRPEAVAVATAVLNAVRGQEATTADGTDRPVSASVGVAMVDDPDLTVDELLIRADLALYDAKDAGRDGYVVHDGRPDGSGMGQRLAWADRIRDALAHDDFVLEAQPIADLQSGAIVHHELLIRMRSDTGELIPPVTFLAVAERFDLIQDIDRWVVVQAIALLEQAARVGEELVLEVNLSGRSLGDTALLDAIRRELQRSGVEPGRLIFEITETAAVANILSAQHFARELEQLGCRFALDDFGAGFGSFYYLKHLPFDFVKIDGEFVRNCASDRTDQVMIAAVVEIARGLGKQTIAEFVGDQAAMDYLRDAGVDLAQGFHIAPPGELKVGGGVPAAGAH